MKIAILSANYIIHNCLKRNLTFLAFLKTTISNSAWYWSSFKKGLFSILKQKGKLVRFLTLNANEIDHQHLLKLLYKTKTKI